MRKIRNQNESDVVWDQVCGVCVCVHVGRVVERDTWWSCTPRQDPEDSTWEVRGQGRGGLGWDTQNGAACGIHKQPSNLMLGPGSGAPERCLDWTQDTRVPRMSLVTGALGRAGACVPRGGA